VSGTRVWQIDLALAVLLAILLIVVSPGLAVAGMVAVLTLLVCGISFAWQLRRRGPRARHTSKAGWEETRTMSEKLPKRPGALPRSRPPRR
jgi:hypothetical protein